VYIRRNIVEWLRNHCCHAKAIRIAFCMCFSFSCPAAKALASCYTVSCELSSSTIFFHIIPWTSRFSIKKGCLNMKCVFRFSLHILSETLQIINIIRRDIIISIDMFYCKGSLFFSDFNKTWILSKNFPKIFTY
jgi:hypothetical protein